jgi:hypothetical protein
LGWIGPFVFGSTQNSVDEELELVRVRFFLLIIAGLILAAALPGPGRSVAEELPWLISPVPAPPVALLAPAMPGIPAWLQAHVGDGDGQISAVVLKRARGYYLGKVRERAVNNPCYFAFDATRPAGLNRRFYVICEASKTFQAVPSGHGNGRNLPGLPDFSNGGRCAKNFSNAEHSKLTTGGGYVTAEIRTSFKGYYRDNGSVQPLMRSFLQFEGEGVTANARDRAIGGHPAVIVRWMCRMKYPQSPHADKDGYVPYGKLIDYSAGRSSGCTSWPPSDSERILSLVENKPTTVYIYPEARDIVAVGRALRAGQVLARAALYWNASCLQEIGVPNFWPREKLEPVLVKYTKNNPAHRSGPLPICKGQ